jgi:hypothetical protein
VGRETTGGREKAAIPEAGGGRGFPALAKIISKRLFPLSLLPIN